jgi:hypothetical protein
MYIPLQTVDNILETVMCCDKLLATLPNVRWAEPVFGITSQLLESSIKFIANNFCGVLSSDRYFYLLDLIQDRSHVMKLNGRKL